MTVIITSDAALSAPLPNTPRLPDITSGVLWEFDANALVGLYADGATVNSFVAAGPDTLANRTFSTTYASWGFPTLSHAGAPGGNATLLFNGAQQIANPTGAAALPQPITYGMMVRSSAFASTQARILSSGGLITGPGNNGYYASNTAAGRMESGTSPTGWVPLIVAFDGAASKIKVGSNAIVTGATGTALTGRTVLGGNGATLSGIGLSGGIAFVRAFSRKLPDSDIDALAAYLRSRYPA